MKLNEKCLERLQNDTEHVSACGSYACRPIGYEQVVALRNFEFEPTDFDNVVLLTLDEAKQAVADYVDVVAETIRETIRERENGNSGEINIKHPKSILLLMERIKQLDEP